MADYTVTNPDGRVIVQPFGSEALLPIVAQAATYLDQFPNYYKGDPGGNVMSVGEFASVVSLNIPIGTDLIQTSGATRGLLLADTTCTDADVAAFSHCVTKTANGRYFRRDERNFNLAQVGLSGGTADDTPAMREAIAYLTKFPGTTFQEDSIFKCAPQLSLPEGLIRLDSPISIKSVIRIVGDVNGTDGGRGCVIQCKSSGFFLDRAETTFGVFTPNNVTTGSDGSYLAGFAMVYTGAQPYDQENGDHGIVLKSHSVIERVNITGFSGCGIRIVATGSYLGATGTEVGNANVFRILNVTCNNNYHGIYIRGSDANAGFILGANVNANASCGVFDESFLGNTHIGHHGSGNGLAWYGTAPTNVSYGNNIYYPVLGADALWSTTVPGTNTAVWRFLQTGGPVGTILPAWVSGTTYKFGANYATSNRNCRSLFLGCYTEGLQAPPQISYPAMAIGGLFTQGGDGMWLNGEQQRVNAFAFQAGGAMMTSDPNAGGGAVGVSGPNLPIFAMKPQGGDVRFDFGNADGYQPFLVNGPGTANALGPNAVRFNYAVGFAGGGACIGYVGAKPTTTLAYPAYALNSARAASTDPMGWTAVPNSSTWLPFGAQAS